MDSLTEDRAIAIYRRETLAAWTRMTRDAARCLDANRYLTDRRRYNRARRKAVRSVLAGLAALSATPPSPATRNACRGPCQ